MSKFKLLDKVKAINDDQVREVHGWICDINGETTYKVTSKEVDVQAKEVVNGYAFFKENELEAVKEEKK